MLHKLINKIENKMDGSDQQKEERLARRVKRLHKINHRMLHAEEFIVVGVVALFSVMLASYTGLDANDPMNSQISNALQAAINQVQPGKEATRVINSWKVDSSVHNTFYKGYCTYGAALISPEFFPYTSPTEQERSRGGNAADWYVNAQLAGYPVGKTPKEGALIIYKRGERFVNAGHVGKVMAYFPEYGKMIVRDMNRVGRSIMSDRREYTDEDNIEGYIYPKAGTVVANPEWVDKNATKELPEVEQADIELVLPEITEAEPVQEEPVRPSYPSLDEVEEEEVVVEEHAVAEEEPVWPSYDTDKMKELIAETSTPAASNEPTVEVEEVLETTPVVVEKPVVPSSPYAVDLDFATLPESAKHFLAQRDVSIETNISTMDKGSQSEITLKIVDKKSGAKFSGILPIAFSLIPSSSNVSLDYSTIQLMFEGEEKIKVTANQAGTAAILINFGNATIGKIKVDIK